MRHAARTPEVIQGWYSVGRQSHLEAMFHPSGPTSLALLVREDGSYQAGRTLTQSSQLLPALAMCPCSSCPPAAAVHCPLFPLWTLPSVLCRPLSPCLSCKWQNSLGALSLSLCSISMSLWAVSHLPRDSGTTYVLLAPESLLQPRLAQ